MLALDPSQQFGPGWMQCFQKLEDADIQGPGHEFNDASDGRFQPSWIWLVPLLTGSVPTDPLPHPDVTTNPTTAIAADNAEIADSMQVHWAKCQAQAERYEEEVVLIVEEMGRILQYFKWKKTWWHSLQSTPEQSSSAPPTKFARDCMHMPHVKSMFTRH